MLFLHTFHIQSINVVLKLRSVWYTSNNNFGTQTRNMLFSSQDHDYQIKVPRTTISSHTSIKKEVKHDANTTQAKWKQLTSTRNREASLLGSSPTISFKPITKNKISRTDDSTKSSYIHVSSLLFMCVHVLTSCLSLSLISSINQTPNLLSRLPVMT